MNWHSSHILRYAVRRLASIPGILLGVILLTFILFNVVGGSPASSVLGKSASPQALEEFDEQNGFNKPLVFGWWTPTRAFTVPDFVRGAAPWATNGSVSLAPASTGSPAAIVLRGKGAEHTIPLAFVLKPNTSYRWTLRYRTDSYFILGTRQGNHQVPPVSSRKPDFTPNRFRTTELTFRTGDDTASEVCTLRVAGENMAIASIELSKRMTHPFDSQFFHYVAGLLRLDFGISSEANESVSSLILRGIGPSLCLTIPIFAGTLVVAVVLGLLSAWFRNRWPDRLLVLGATLLMSINYVVWVIAGQYVLAFRMGWFPVWGFESWAYLLLPVIIGIATGMGRDLRFYRAVTLEEMNKEYVRTAMAKGSGPARILFRHVLPNVLIPVITNVSLSLPFLFTGSLLLESYFGVPGLGNLSLNAIHAADVNVVRAIVVIGAILYMFANLAADILYGVVDPRARVE